MSSGWKSQNGSVIVRCVVVPRWVALWWLQTNEYLPPDITDRPEVLTTTAYLAYPAGVIVPSLFMVTCLLNIMTARLFTPRPTPYQLVTIIRVEGVLFT